ncbi:hypothetical protein INP83_11565 [Mucilaginibacter sp. 21P]|uniref:hypothetical protein n=1 Tax=Mucilaginibacter sp. 21P TaxID=2778902 RepID=UPI001C5A5756|nr:hypothetical protein [Mucilaginibacter sp. 21P]QXV63745.1 hypothetical protein INP83_11565 [Mucilaginibacter sp. 21P]
MSAKLLDNAEFFEMIIDELSMNTSSESSLAKISASAARIQHNWILAFASNVSDQLLTRYFTSQLRSLSKLGSCMTSLLDYPSLDRLSDTFIRGYFSCVEPGALLDDWLLAKLTAPLTDQTQQVREMVANELASGPVSEFLSRYVDECSGKTKLPITVGQFRYFQIVIFRLYHEFNSGSVIADRLTDLFIALEFNQFEIFIDAQELIQRRLSALSGDDWSSEIGKLESFYRFQSKGDVPRYDPRWPPLSAMIAEWLAEEIAKAKACAESARKVLKGNVLKLQLKLSLAQLALLVRLLHKSDVFGGIQINSIFRFFCRHFSTKRQAEISERGFSKEYYAKDMVTAVEIRALLTKMIKQINTDYFPAMAVICAAIFPC